jgi:hypothetical protein
MKKTAAYEISGLIGAIHRCREDSNKEWEENHTQRLLQLVKDYMPGEPGFDSDTTIDIDKSSKDKLVFYTSFHHMDENGFYDGWTEHTVTVTPGFRGANIKISGRDRNCIKDIIHETFDFSLDQEIKKEANKP